MDSQLLRSVQLTQLDISKEIKKICEKHQIPYFLDGGSLLGAVRHKGFIPWDDDMDICMLRKDYNRFLKVAPKELPEEYHINSPYTREEYSYVLSRVLNAHSISYDSSRLYRFHHCPYIVGIDIFPLDTFWTTYSCPRSVSME